MNKVQQILMLTLLLGCSAAVRAAPMGPDVDRVYQFFVPSAAGPSRPNLGAYLWVPPNTPRIRAVLVAMHNGLPIHILQSAPVRAACRKYGVAQILMTPWAKDIGEVMLKNLTYDVTDPTRTAVYDGYLSRLADDIFDSLGFAAPARYRSHAGNRQTPERSVRQSPSAGFPHSPSRQKPSLYWLL